MSAAEILKAECPKSIPYPAARTLVGKEVKTGNSSKPFWNCVRSKRKVKCDLVSLKANDSYLNDDLSIANCMNSYFSSVFTVEDNENFPDLE